MLKPRKIARFISKSTSMTLYNKRFKVVCKPNSFSYCTQVFLADYRQDAAKRQTAGIVFTHRPKIRFFAPQGRLVAPIQVKFAGPTGTWVRLAVQNFTSIGAEGWECGPQLSKISTFWQRVALQGRLP